MRAIWKVLCMKFPWIISLFSIFVYAVTREIFVIWCRNGFKICESCLLYEELVSCLRRCGQCVILGCVCVRYCSINWIIRFVSIIT